MKKVNFLRMVVLFSFLLTASLTWGGDAFWFGVDGPVPLIVDSTKVTVRLDGGIGGQDQEALFASILRIVEEIGTNHAFDGFTVCSLSTSQGYYAFIDSLTAVPGVYLAEPYYLNADSVPNLVGQHIVVAFHDWVSDTQIDSINAIHNIERHRQSMDNVYDFRKTDLSGVPLLDIANWYHQLPEVAFAKPDFLARIETQAYVVYDHYADFQYSIKAVIGDFNERSVWDFAGLEDSVIVAVLDYGVDEHEDLPAERILPGMDCVNWDYDARPGPEMYHGMCCAGLIGASHTRDYNSGTDPNSGIISVNPNTLIVPVKIFDDTAWGDSITDYGLRCAFDYAWDWSEAAVLSNSWTFWLANHPEIPEVNSSIMNAYVSGRGGRGCPIIFSAGNYGVNDSALHYPAYLSQCLAVGAIDANGYRLDYSSCSPNVDLVAVSGPSGAAGDIWSLDQMGVLGINNGESQKRDDVYVWDCGLDTNDIDYDCHFSGTSAACPVVAGIASLLIAKDSTLMVEEIYDILKKSAVRDLGPGVIDTPSVEYGYGRVDAFRAVLSIARGDVTNDGSINLANISKLIDYVYMNGPEPFPSRLLGDCNCNGKINLADIGKLISYVYQDGELVIPCYLFE